MKKKLLLETVLKMKADVERSINATFEDVVKYNFTEKKVESLMTRLDKLEAQLIHFKEVIQEANKSKFEGKTNNYHIYYLSNLVARQRFYENLIKALNRSPKKAESAQIQKEEATSKQQQTGEEITKFQNKLSAFNSKKKVTVYLDESLNLL
jgi:hypothetical protein